MYRAFSCLTSLGLWFFGDVALSLSKSPQQGDLFSATFIVNDKQQHEHHLDKRSTVLWNHAVARIAVGDERAALSAFTELLRQKPDFYPSTDTPPKIMTPFHQARRQFLTEQHARNNFRAIVVDQAARDGRIRLTIGADDALLALVTEIAVHIKTRSQSTFRSVNLKPTTARSTTLLLDFAYPMSDDEHLDYYIDFVGNFNESFYAIGSATAPRFLNVEETDTAPEVIVRSSSAITQLKSGWPIVISAALAVAGALTYGLLKINL